MRGTRRRTLGIPSGAQLAETTPPALPKEAPEAGPSRSIKVTAWPSR